MNEIRIQLGDEKTCKEMLKFLFPRAYKIPNFEVGCDDEESEHYFDKESKMIIHVCLSDPEDVEAIIDDSHNFFDNNPFPLGKTKGKKENERKMRSL